MPLICALKMGNLNLVIFSILLDLHILVRLNHNDLIFNEIFSHMVDSFLHFIAHIDDFIACHQ